MRLSSSALLVGVALTTAACSQGYRSSYEQCRDEPRAWGEGTSRSGGFEERLGFNWGDWGKSYGYPVRWSVTERIQGCRHIVSFADGARRWQTRPYGYVDSFGTDPSGLRFAFVASDDKEYAVIDGVEGPPWDDVLWPPTFSNDGQHVAYLAKDAAGGAVVLDGKVIARAAGFVANNFSLDDGGTVAAVAQRADGKVVVVRGEQTSGAFDEICELSFVVSAAKRFAFVGRRAGRFLAVVDFIEIDAPGVPSGCDVIFSADGKRYAYSTVAHRRKRDGSDEQTFSVVIDGEVHVFSGRADVARLTSDLALVSYEKQSFVQHLKLMGATTPDKPPSADDYHPPQYYGTPGTATRVELGDSIGPAFDSVELESFARSPDGHVSYVGLRGGARFAVLDNVLQAPPPPAPAPVIAE
jgi:hypothetical protein